MPRPAKPWFRAQTGWWMVTYQGRQRMLAKGRQNKKLAQSRFHQLMSAADEPIDELSIGAVCRKFLRWSKKHHAKDTYRNHDFYITRFRRRYGKMPVRRLEPKHITRWVDSEPWNPTSQYNAKRFVFRAFNWAADEGLIPANPLKGMKRPQPMPRQRAMTEAEYKSLLKAARGPFKVVLFSLWNTGARPAEVRRLKWDEVHDGYWKILKHKTSKQTGKPRIIRLNRPMRRLMQTLPRQGEHVFLNFRGKPWTTNAVVQQIGKLKKKLGLADDVCAYLTRHAFGTNAILRGVDVATTAALLGHSSLEMVSKVYCHVAEQHEHLQSAVEKITLSPKISKDAQR